MSDETQENLSLPISVTRPGRQSRLAGGRRAHAAGRRAEDRRVPRARRAEAAATAYCRQLAEVRRAIEGLAAAGGLATKLTLGSRVARSSKRP